MTTIVTQNYTGPSWPTPDHAALSRALTDRNLPLFQDLVRGCTAIQLYRTGADCPASILFQTLSAGKPFLEALSGKVHFYYHEKGQTLLEAAKDQEVVDYILQHQIQSMGWTVTEDPETVTIHSDTDFKTFTKGSGYKFYYEGREYEVTLKRSSALPSEAVVADAQHLFLNEVETCHERDLWRAYADKPSQVIQEVGNIKYRSTYPVSEVLYFNAKQVPYVLQVQFDEVLGKGGTKTVFSTDNILAKREYVVAKIDRRREASIDRELKTQRHLYKRFPHLILEHITRFNVGKEIYVVSEHGGKTLDKVWSKISGLQRKNVFEQLINFLEYIHSKNKFHFDIKPANFLLKKEGEGYAFKIPDLGSIRSLKTLKALPIKNLKDCPQLPNECADLSKVTSGEKVDVYSLAWTINTLMTDRKGMLPVVEWTQTWQSLIIHMFNNSPVGRPALAKVKAELESIPPEQFEAITFYDRFIPILNENKSSLSMNVELAQKVSVKLETPFNRLAILNHPNIDRHDNLIRVLVSDLDVRDLEKLTTSNKKILSVCKACHPTFKD